MLKIKVTEKSGAFSEYQSESMIDPSQMGHGLPERWIPASEPHDPADVIESESRMVKPEIPAVLDEQGVEVSPAVPALMEVWVKLKAEYTVEIQDISAQHALAEVIAKRVAEYPSPQDFLNAFFDGGEPALEVLKNQRLAIKAKYPKP